MAIKLAKRVHHEGYRPCRSLLRQPLHARCAKTKVVAAR